LLISNRASVSQDSDSDDDEDSAMSINSCYGRTYFDPPLEKYQFTL